MLILAFESSAKAASVALLQDGALLGEYYQNSGQTHSRTLTQMAEDLLRNCDRSPRNVDAVAVASGPGSFTGVRIGVAAAKGFCWALQLPCLGVSTLEAMAEGCRHMDGVICCAMDARREQIYNALFRAQGGALERLTPDRAISLEQLREEFKNIESRKILVGDGAQLCYNTLVNECSGLLLLPEHLRFQRAGAVALVAWPRLQSGKGEDAAGLVPNYLRLSQAERERLEKLGRN